jgi:uncharacterized protein (TIGR03435 family)
MSPSLRTGTYERGRECQSNSLRELAEYVQFSTDSWFAFGLKLEKEKRPVPVLVIDHVEQKPTDN